MNTVTYSIIVNGRVQGVGFRPLVCRLAKELSIKGTVKNTGGIVEIIAQGSHQALLSLMEKIQKAPLPIEVDVITYKEIASTPFSDFQSIISDGKPKGPIFPSDIAICQACEKELLDSVNRHFQYPYISCTACGPRYTIIEKLPYDREHTTMKEMDMCEDCAKEYVSLSDRRCHGETISCPHCGPQLLEWGKISSAPMDHAIHLIQEGGIILVKAMGGYQLVCRSDIEESVQKLRTIKHREKKPFALMVKDLDMAKKVVYLSEKEKKLLISPVRPIILAKRKVMYPLGASVANEVPRLGICLPSTGFYVLLMQKMSSPLVVTSANQSGEPMIFTDEKAKSFYESHTEISGCFTYQRDILRPADDSVVQVNGGAAQILRRTRGYLPEPVLKEKISGHVLATGSDMEPGFCITGGGRYYPCQVPCEWDNERSERFIKKTEEEWEKMLGIVPQTIISDNHPRYLSSLWGKELAKNRGIPFVTVQHHHAHALSVMAEHHLQGPVLAFVFDGTGYGEDGTIWGGEILLCKENEKKRVGHIKSISMIGGDLSMKQAWKTALCYLASGHLPSSDPRYELVDKALKAKINCIENSSVGRLFDGVSSLLGLADVNQYKGECPMVLEKAAWEAIRKGQKGTELSFKGKEEPEGYIWDPIPLIESLLESHDTIEEKALGFHNALVDMIKESALHFGIPQVILSGGCFANGILMEKARAVLEKDHFQVYTNEKVPCGDGGIALGQAYYGCIS